MKKWYNYLVILGLFSAMLFFFVSTVCTLSVGLQNPVPLIHRQAITFRIDKDFTIEEVRAISSALYRWEVASDYHFRFTMYVDSISFGEMFRWKSDGLPTIYKATSLFSWKSFVGRFMSGPAKDTVGLAMIYTGDIFIYATDVEDLLLEKIVVHEIGHVIAGSWHSYDNRSVMYPTLYDPMNAVIQKLDVTLAIDFVKYFDEEVRKK